MEAGKEAPPTAPAEAARLKIVGAWSGFLEVQLESWTIPMLRSEVAERSGVSSGCIKLFCGGRVLQNGDGRAPSLLAWGLKNNSKVLAIAIPPPRSPALAKIRDNALAFTELHVDKISFSEKWDNMESGGLTLPEVKVGSVDDHRAITMSQMLHIYARGFIRRLQYKNALDLLSMAEEYFSLCDPMFVEMIFNEPILDLDIVWCYFMLRDISCLSVAGTRLATVRKCLGSSDCAELAIYMRLELLEGVLAYHSGNFVESRKALSSAQAKYAQLQVPDEALSLPMTGQGKCAVDSQVEEQANKIYGNQEDIQRQDEIMNQKTFEKTLHDTTVEHERLNELISIGIERDLAEEALQRNENDTQKALDDSTDPEKNCDLQHQIELREKVKAPGSIVAIDYDRSADHQDNDDGLGALRALAQAAVIFFNQQAETDPPTQGQASDPPTRDQEGPLGAAAATAGRVDEQRHTAAIEDVNLDAEVLEAMEEDNPFSEPGFMVKMVGEAIAEYLALLDSAADESKGSG